MVILNDDSIQLKLQNNHIKSKLKPHQLIGLKWLMNKEANIYTK